MVKLVQHRSIEGVEIARTSLADMLLLESFCIPERTKSGGFGSSASSGLVQRDSFHNILQPMCIIPPGIRVNQTRDGRAVIRPRSLPWVFSHCYDGNLHLPFPAKRVLGRLLSFVFVPNGYMQWLSPPRSRRDLVL
jgi:hypothetical protein